MSDKSQERNQPSRGNPRQPEDRSTSQLMYDFTSRKFLVFVYVTVASSWLMWKQQLPADEYVQLILWVTLLYFGANLWQTQLGRPTSSKFRQRLFSRKFIVLLALMVFFTFAVSSAILPAAQFTTLVIWMTGIYFGIDIGELHSFRGMKGVGRMFRDDVDPTPYPGPFDPTPTADDRVTTPRPYAAATEPESVVHSDLVPVVRNGG